MTEKRKYVRKKRVQKKKPRADKEPPGIKVPATFDEWGDESQVVCNLDIHVYSIKPLTPALEKKLTAFVNEECEKIVLLLRKRLKAKSKKLGMGCRII